MLFGVKLKFGYFLVMLLSLAGFTSCEDDIQKRIDERKALEEQEIKTYLTDNKITNAQRQASGLYYVPVSPGTGNTIKKGNSVRFHYIGRTTQGDKFESTYDSGQPHLVEKVGLGQTMKGWDEGLQLMSPDENAILILPSHLSVGSGPVRVYEIKIMEVK